MNSIFFMVYKVLCDHQILFLLLPFTMIRLHWPTFCLLNTKLLLPQRLILYLFQSLFYILVWTTLRGQFIYIYIFPLQRPKETIPATFHNNTTFILYIFTAFINASFYVHLWIYFLFSSTRMNILQVLRWFILQINKLSVLTRVPGA